MILALAKAVVACLPFASACGVDGFAAKRATKAGESPSGDRLFGVNYLAPFSASYAQMRCEGIDPRMAMRRDVAQFVRLGLDGIRVHYYDREISTDEGGLVENDHLALMDELIALCASNGMKTVVTMISAWPTPCCIGGFASRWTRRELSSVPEAIGAECRFVGELANHVNPFTGKRYADDSAIAAFELFNEPAYPAKFPDAKVTEFVNRLADALRSSGTVKPIYYNCWQKREKACSLARIDGVSGSIYPTGLDSGAARIGNCLSMVRRSSIRDVPEIRNMKKMIYEFDAADVSGAYMYPAMARQFRAEGVGMAFQFHYVATAIAPRNLVCRTHHLNLFHTPSKALSLAIAAEVFRSLPAGERFDPCHEEMSFAPFRIVPSKNLSEMVTEESFIHTADTTTVPPATGKLKRIWGCGRSAVCGSDGNGCFFLDRLTDDSWRLQLAPSVRGNADPFSGGKSVKTIILPDPVELTVALKDLGGEYTIWSPEGVFVKRAEGGKVSLRAGDYVLTAAPFFGDEVRRAASVFPYPPFVPPDPGPITAPVCDTASSDGGGNTRWSFFSPVQSLNAYVKGAKITKEKDPDANTAVAMRLPDVNTANTFAKISSGCDDLAFSSRFPSHPPCATVVVRARACEPATDRMEMVVRDNRGYAWMCHIPLTTQWRDIRISADKFRYYRHANGRKPPEGTVFDIGKAIDIQFGIGKWLFPEKATAPHGIAVSYVTFE